MSEQGSTADYDAGRNDPCANCGHRYGRHTLADCQQMIPIDGGEKSCDCPGWASVLPPAG